MGIETAIYQDEHYREVGLDLGKKGKVWILASKNPEPKPERFWSDGSYSPETDTYKLSIDFSEYNIISPYWVLPGGIMVDETMWEETVDEYFSSTINMLKLIREYLPYVKQGMKEEDKLI